MSTLRITQIKEESGRHRVEIALEGDGLPRQVATVHFDFEVTAQEQEDLRWYLEDFLQYPHDPAPKIAARIEQRMTEIGTSLFRALFHSGDDARDLWATLRPRLNDTRVEVVTSVREATAIPWELTRDPKTDTPLALRAQAFVRTHPQAAQRPRLAQTESGPIRILLVICRPKADEDIPFRSVASRLVKGLSAEVRALFELDVLRPPTFDQLGRVLRAGKAGGKPYHVVHFDGHGTYVDVKESGGLSGILQALSTLVLSAPRSGEHGYLLFENPTHKDNVQLVDGAALGELLVEADVPVLVLNACKSAYAEPAGTPVAAHAQTEDVHAEIRALAPLALEVMDAGVPGVVAMRYTVYVVTAAQFVADLYAALAQGSSVGEAVSLGRKQLAANPLREIAYEARPLQDWAVPVVYEAAPIALFPKLPQDKELTITLDERTDIPERGNLDDRLPARPDVGFFGRDETLLALDRRFDDQPIVLLHAYAGSGKTATAAEFARWYALTGGVQGPVLFTSFEQYIPLPRVLDRIGDVFGGPLEQSGVNWLALDDDQRRNIALQVLKRVPVLWIWDNIEPIAGFPTGTKSAWSAEEQQELVEFLRAARDTKARFLLASRRNEKGWLGDLPARVAVPPMPMQERVQLARALADKHGRKLTDVDEWRQLFQFTRGNPLTITVLVGQALREGLKTKHQIEAFVARLRAGEASFADEASEGRSKSLGASLNYGFEHSFSEREHKQLALLHFFQGFVNVDVLNLMGSPEADWCVPEVRGLTREVGITLLDRAAEVGLLAAHGGGYYTIHPALPWFFKTLFDKHYPAPANPPSEIRNPELDPARAFVEAMGLLGSYYQGRYEQGNREVIGLLRAEEVNMLHARELACKQGWWGPLLTAMQGLDQLYAHTGRRAERARLVNGIVPDFVDPDTDGPLPGREDYWSIVTQYRVRLAVRGRELLEAERLQRLCVTWDRQRAAPALAAVPKTLGPAAPNEIHTLAASLHDLGEIQRKLAQPGCVTTYEESLALYEQLGSRIGTAICAFNLGNAYKNVASLRDLSKAEQWYQRSLDLRDEGDGQGQAKCLSQLGFVARARFHEARAQKKPEEELVRYFNAALQFYHKALELDPPDAVEDLAVDHTQLGNIYCDVGDLDQSLVHYRKAIGYSEAAGDLCNSGQTRYNVAVALAKAGRLGDAREYAEAALRNFETFGDRAADDIQKARKLIAHIEEDLQAQGG